jgi:hypothetical protein
MRGVVGKFILPWQEELPMEVHQQNNKIVCVVYVCLVL